MKLLLLLHIVIMFYIVVVSDELYGTFIIILEYTIVSEFYLISGL